MARTETKDAEAAPARKKKGGFMKIAIIVVIVLLVFAGGVGGGLYAMQAGLLGGGEHGAKVDPNRPRLVPKSEEKRAQAGEGEGHGSNREALGAGGDKYASTYYALEKEFTSNMRESVHFIQVGIAVSTPYDERVIENLKTHEIAVRSAVLLALGDVSEEQAFTAQGKREIQIHIAHAINDVLKRKEGFGGIGNVYFTNFVVQ